MLLGDLIEKALSLIGVTSERMKYLVGECKCAERKVFLNLLHRWSMACMGGILSGRMSISDCKRHYNVIMEDFENVVRSTRGESQKEKEEKDKL